MRVIREPVCLCMCAPACAFVCVYCMHGSEWLMGGDGLIGWVGTDCAAIQQGDLFCCRENSG